jgi:hypothetical protein
VKDFATVQHELNPAPRAVQVDADDLEPGVAAANGNPLSV